MYKQRVKTGLFSLQKGKGSWAILPELPNRKLLRTESTRPS